MYQITAARRAKQKDGNDGRRRAEPILRWIRNPVCDVCKLRAYRTLSLTRGLLALVTHFLQTVRYDSEDYEIMQADMSVRQLLARTRQCLRSILNPLNSVGYRQSTRRVSHHRIELVAGLVEIPLCSANFVLQDLENI